MAATRRGNGGDTTPLPPIPETKAAVLASARHNDDDDEIGETEVATRATDGSLLPAAPGSGPAPIYVETKGTGDLWELTWPIWHMLPHDERKAIAVRHGMKSIGEFEEYMTLSKAVSQSEEGRAPSAAAPYECARLYEMENDPRLYGVPTVAERSNLSSGTEEDERKPAAARTSVVDGSDNDDDSSTASSSNEDDDDERGKYLKGVSEDSTPSSFAVDVGKEQSGHLERIEKGGLPCLLPDEVLARTFSFLPVDAHGILALVSPHWKSFTRSEAVYRRLCERCYLIQSRRKTLHVSRFGNSYLTMLERRPRVRTGGGVYVLKYSEVRKVQRDMWTEVPHGVILETVYFRYMYFHEDGRVLYALTHAPPNEMIARFAQMIRTGVKDKNAVWGRYEVKKYDVVVWASHPWHDVRMEMRLIPEGVEGARGRFCAMSFEKHMSSASGDFDEYYSRDLVEYKVPLEPFRFLRDWRI